MQIYRQIQLFIPFLFIFSNFISAQDILEWRGIDRTGYFPSTDLLDEWPEDGPELLLEVDHLPKSYSSVVVKDQIMYTTGIVDSTEILTALYMDGSIKWSTVYGKAWDQSFPNARCTPTIEGGLAYVISGRGDVACIGIWDGEIKWSFDGYADFHGRSGTWGVAESPLIVDDKVIYTPGGDQTSMVAVDKKSGKVIWQSESMEERTAYTSPVYIERDSYKMIITVLANHVICVNAEDGSLLWKYNYLAIDAPSSGGDINPVTPIVVGNDVFVTSGYNHIGIMLHMSDDFSSVKLKWKTSDLDVHHGGVVEMDGYLYAANYTSIVDGNWTCLDWDTGEVQFEENWKGKGSIIASDGKLICYDERRGHVGLVDLTPKEFVVKSSFRVAQGRGPHWSHPTIFGDKLFIRHGEALVVYGIGAEER
jgi:outer membrane protein assembly factor BamB